MLNFSNASVQLSGIMVWSILLGMKVVFKSYPEALLWAEGFLASNSFWYFVHVTNYYFIEVNGLSI